MPRLRFVAGLIAVVVLIVRAPVLMAQVPGTLTGIIRDSAGRPLREAVVVLDPTKESRVTRADAAGRFRFDRLRAGRYVLRTTWIGYVPDERTIDVSSSGSDVAITLARVPVRLDTLLVVGHRKGIFGTTAERGTLDALGGVNVSVLRTPNRARTQSDGKFAFEQVPIGGWIVQASRDGYATMLVPVTVSDTAAVELALALELASTKEQQIKNNRVREVQLRINRAQMNASALVGYQEFGMRKRQSLEVALQSSPSFLTKGLRLEGKECVLIDGMPRPNIGAKDILAEDVAMVEAYNHRGLFVQEIMELFKDYGMECGVGPVVEVYGRPGEALKSSRPGNPAVVAFISVWLK